MLYENKKSPIHLDLIGTLYNSPRVKLKGLYVIDAGSDQKSRSLFVGKSLVSLLRSLFHTVFFLVLQCLGRSLSLFKQSILPTMNK